MSRESMKQRDLVFVDIETTGLDPHTHEIIEIAVLRVRQDWPEEGLPTFAPALEWSTKVKPTHIGTADPVSLKINKYTEEEWSDAMNLDEAMKLFIEKADDGVMVAHNVAFDAAFIDQALHTHGIQNTMHYHRIDTVSMAFGVLHNVPEVNRYSLNELCKYFSITNEKAHTALSDVRADFALFRKLMAYE